MDDARQIKYQVIDLVLTNARDNEKTEIFGYNLSVLSIDAGATATIRFNETGADAIALEKTSYIESKFARFYITNSAQAGLHIKLIVGQENFKHVPR